MNCPRCTSELPDGSRYCSSCGLDLELLREEPFQQEESRGLDEPLQRTDPPRYAEPGPAPGTEPRGESGPVYEEEQPWPSFLRIKFSGGQKRPALAATLAFFLGPVSYLYLEQATWFWLGLLGGFFLLILSQGTLLPLLLLGGMIHSYDVAEMMNRRLADYAYDETDHS